MLTRRAKAYNMPMLIRNRFHERCDWPTSEK